MHRKYITVDKTNLNGFVERDFAPIKDYPPGTLLQHQEYGVEVHFSDLEEALCRLIRGSHRVIGCVSWLTSIPVLEALEGCEAVSLVVQKEEFLRPELMPDDGWRKKLRSHYDALRGGISASSFDFRFSNVDPIFGIKSHDSLEAVRCCGIVDKSAANVPRMHHKFFVFFRRLGDYHQLEKVHGAVHIPVAVWTGSFNPSANGTRSLENAVTLMPPWIADMDNGYLSDLGFGDRLTGDVCNAYIEEWARVVGISDPISWEYSDLPVEPLG